MKLAFSNIAWNRDEDAAVAAVLVSRGIAGVEIAPTAVWPAPLARTPGELTTYRENWQGLGLRVVALQAILYGRPQLRVFGAEDSQRALVQHVDGMFSLAAALGAHALVFGSPGNRRRDGLPFAEAVRRAAVLFRELAGLAQSRGVVLCIEPNPEAYQCDFVVNGAEAVTLAEAVDHPGFGIHLDAGGLKLSGEDPNDAVQRALPWLRHVHASEPHLVPFGVGGAQHALLADALREVGYDGWVSVEMRRIDGVPAIEHAAAAFAAVYA
ncbi:MAG: sugar phosphate isomerase/epimerase family protein [Gemmatimonadaceae bacterium]